MERRAKIYPETKESIQSVLLRDKLRYRIETSSEQMILFVENCSQSRMKEIFTDAACERQRKKNGDGIPVYSVHTIKNQKKMQRLQEINKTKNYRVYNRT